MQRGLIGWFLVGCVAIAACGPTNVPSGEGTPSPTPIPEVTADASPVATPPIAQAPSDTDTQATIDIGGFTLDEIYDLGAAGCGMTLWRTAAQDAAPGERTFILVNGMEENSMLMKLNDEVMRFRRTEHSGEEFFGQYPEQTFANETRGVQVQVSVDAGSREASEGEVITISSGTVTVTMGGEVVDIPVVGDVGC